MLARLSLNTVTFSLVYPHSLKLNGPELTDTEQECFFRNGKAVEGLHRKIEKTITA